MPPLNDGDEGNEFSSSLEDEDVFDAHYPPGHEIGGIPIQPDRGSGSYAEDGRLEVAEDTPMMDGETQLGSYAERGPSEIGDDGYVAHDGPSEIGLGEIEPEVTPFDLFMASPTRMGSAAMYGPTEIGDANVMSSQYEIGAAAAADREGSEIGAVVKVVEKARDNRQPPPPMQAVDADAPPREFDDWGLTDVVVGAGVASGGADAFPLTSQLLLRAGAATEPRFVRVDTEESYRRFRVENSPELSDLQDRLERHLVDPNAHALSSDLEEDVDELVNIGAAVEADKQVELWMPKRFDGKVTAWREGEYVCASMALPGIDGEVRICTSLEPIRKCVAEMARHATEAGVPASSIVGVLPAMGCVLGAGTALKEMAAAAPSILRRPEAAHKGAFVVRIEPKVNPALCALAMLAAACTQGNPQACDEWQRLSRMSPGPVQQAMADALQLVKAAG